MSLGWAGLSCDHLCGPTLPICFLEIAIHTPDGPQDVANGQTNMPGTLASGSPEAPEGCEVPQASWAIWWVQACHGTLPLSCPAGLGVCNPTGEAWGGGFTAEQHPMEGGREGGNCTCHQFLLRQRPGPLGPRHGGSTSLAVPTTAPSPPHPVHFAPVEVATTPHSELCGHRMPGPLGAPSTSRSLTEQLLRRDLLNEDPRGAGGAKVNVLFHLLGTYIPGLGLPGDVVALCLSR